MVAVHLLGAPGGGAPKHSLVKGFSERLPGKQREWTGWRGAGASGTQGTEELQGEKGFSLQPLGPREPVGAWAPGCTVRNPSLEAAEAGRPQAVEGTGRLLVLARGWGKVGRSRAASAGGGVSDCRAVPRARDRGEVRTHFKSWKAQAPSCVGVSAGLSLLLPPFPPFPSLAALPPLLSPLPSIPPFLPCTLSSSQLA